MEAIVNVKLTRLTDSVHGRRQHVLGMNYFASYNSVDGKCHYYCYREKLGLDCRNASIRVVVAGLERDQGCFSSSAQPTSVEKRQCDLGRPKTPEEQTRAEMYCQKSGSVKKSPKPTFAADNRETPRPRKYRGPHQTEKYMSTEETISQARSSESVEEFRKASRGSSASWVSIAGAESPLNADEEQCLSADVQDMLFLESQKEDLEKIIGREPTRDEWAGHCRISIFNLYARIGKGRAAKRKMIAANLPLVNSMAQQFHGRGLSHWELCQEGVQGLEKSTEKYNTSHNTKFSSYSFLWVWQRMSAGVKKFRNVLRISRTVYEMASTLLRRKEEFLVFHGRQPSLQELADLCHVDEDKVHNVTRLTRPVKSMDESVSTHEDEYQIQVEDRNPGCVPWAHIMESELKTEVAKALKCLTSREKMVLEMRYGLCGEPPKGRAQVGLALNLTYESIRLIESKALNKLRHSVREDGLQQYLFPF